MTDRIIDISDCSVFLKCNNELLMIEKRENMQKTAVPLKEVGVLCISNPAVTLTHAVLSGIARNGGIVVTCGSDFLPVAMMLPLDVHHLQAERISFQVNASIPVKKQLWQQVIKNKIASQANVLLQIYQDDSGLKALSAKVRSGDADNLEAQAAKIYWGSLFREIDFRRERYGNAPNQLLNYGYAVLRAITARAVCCSGLHPSIGIRHHNRYDSFRLADDLMEPFRYIVDTCVYGLFKENFITELDRETKQRIVSSLLEKVSLSGEMRSLFDVISRISSSMADVFAGKRKKLILPDV